MNILVTLDKNYLSPLKTMLLSMFMNNPNETFEIYLISDDLRQDDLLAAMKLCERFHSVLHLIHVEDDSFNDAPTLRYYSRAMYYRLLAGELLPASLDRILYLDPDILVIGSLRPLYDTPFVDELYAACIHKGLINISSPVNKIRLSNYETEGYYNSGVLLMNLERIRLCILSSKTVPYSHSSTITCQQLLLTLRLFCPPSGSVMLFHAVFAIFKQQNPSL